MSKPTASTARRPRASASDVDELVTAVLGASRVLVGVSARSLSDIEDAVTLTQFRTLVVLSNSGEINLNRLAELLDVTPSTAMRMIDRLLAADLVTRRDNPANRREVVLGLTDGGEQLVRQVTAKRRREIARIVTAMPEAQRNDLVDALRAFADAAGEPEPRSAVGTAVGW
ncbi:MarR family transcriptional regulator [Jatrophihabitans telluris]|uniref:MarR family transcriptional regulator n=1 Tax=Jatrophihabitans telluris TaxID=2038343 RepID=A0ABY4QUE7_9ACTN|nr:MarR family transcriptional regulator [Jatrophihabitans telluris]UQX87053.1 MarR family transcriptional regulator [Jatrophihabitans telluris]